MVVLAIRDGLLGCSIAVLRLWVVVVIWLSLPIRLAWVRQPTGEV